MQMVWHHSIVRKHKIVRNIDVILVHWQRSLQGFESFPTRKGIRNVNHKKSLLLYIALLIVQDICYMLDKASVPYERLCLTCSSSKTETEGENVNLEMLLPLSKATPEGLNLNPTRIRTNCPGHGGIRKTRSLDQRR